VVVGAILGLVFGGGVGFFAGGAIAIALIALVDLIRRIGR
jgi:hypothetical protein